VVLRRQRIRSELASGSVEVRDAVFLEDPGGKPHKLSVVAKNPGRRWDPPALRDTMPGVPARRADRAL